ncbi:MAG TPA: cyclic-di-AMP receptor [Capsulimonadaceae bacterium]|jgi:uncharacterized protein YaaQ
MKLIIGIAHDRDKRRLFDGLIEAGVKFTVLSSTGGFLRRGNVTVLIGSPAEELEKVIGVFREQCRTEDEYVQVPSEYNALIGVAAIQSQPVKVKAGGGIVLVIDVERVETF